MKISNNEKIGIIIGILILVILIIPQNQVNGATCSGTTCNDKDPYDYGCSAITKKQIDKSGSSGDLHVELRYSSGCNSTWTRSSNVQLNIRHLYAELDKNNATYTRLTYENLNDYSYIWSNMWVSSVGRCIRGKMGPNNSSFDTITTYSCWN